MEAYREPNPFDQPFSESGKILKRHLLMRVNNAFAQFEKEKKTLRAMESFLRLNETDLLTAAGEIGGRVKLQMEQFVQFCADYANGHGKIDRVATQLKELQMSLRG